jgi:16S rRNA (uracil1498-N3)-methyltransferase
VVERDDRSPVISLFWGEPLAVGELRLDGAPARHVRVRRAEPGDRVRLLDGRGRVASGRLVAITKTQAIVSVERIVEIPRAAALEVIAPIADRDRMLLAAEKCVELQVTAWRPAYFARSRSVTPRGEGTKFHEKVKVRMQSALEQSGGAWLPDVHPDAEAVDAMEGVSPAWKRVYLESVGRPLSELVSNDPTALAVGPEGGFERHELAAAESRGWVAASLGPTTLRFETAVIAGAAVIRATQLSLRSK